MYRNANPGARRPRGNYRANRTGANGQQVKRGTYNSGITEYNHSARPSRNPYARSNMIYSKPPRRRWSIAVIVVIVLIAIIGITSYACSHNGQPVQQAPESSQPAQTETTSNGEQSSEDSSAQSQDDSSSASEQAQEQSSSTNSQEGVEKVTTAAGALSINRSAENRMATSTSTNTTKPSQKTVYLTFDDGPSTETPKILEILNKYGVHATWFVIGNRGHLSSAKDIWDAGNQVALHSYTHEYESDYKSVASYYKGLDKLNDDLEKILGFKATLFRFPGGSVNSYNGKVQKGLIAECKSRNWHYFDWNISSGDAAGNNVPASKILKNIKKESAGKNSCCVLMHDTEAKATTVDALEDIIKYYIKQGFTFDVLTADSFSYAF